MSRVLVLLLAVAGCHGYLEDPLGVVYCDSSWSTAYANPPEKCERVCEVPPQSDGPGCTASGFACPSTFEADVFGEVRGCCGIETGGSVIEFYACDD